MCAFCLAVLLALGSSSPMDETAEAIRLAHAGAHEEALGRFQAHTARYPADIDARIWTARLLWWTGRASDAEHAYRSILTDAPEAVDAMLGLAHLLTITGRRDEAFLVLARADERDPGRAETLAAMGRLQRAAGRTGLALDYYRRAARLAPGDADIRRGLESTRVQHAHRLNTTFVYEQLPRGLPAAPAGGVELTLRMSDRLRVGLHQQAQRRFDTAEARTGAGLEVRPNGSIFVRGAVLVSPGATVLPRTDALVEIEGHTRTAELSGSVRLARFGDARVWVAAPGLTFPLGDHLALAGRYFVSLTSFDRQDVTVVNHSALMQLRARVHQRLWLTGGYARGNESFDTLSVDRIGRFRADTVGAGIRLDTPWLSSVGLAAERQWSDAGDLWRLTTGLAQRF